MKKKRSSLLAVALGLLGTVIITASVIGLYSWSIVKEANIGIYQENFQLSSEAQLLAGEQQKMGGILEKDGQIELDDLRSFYLFTTSKMPFDLWFKQQVELNSLAPLLDHPNEVIAKQNLILPPLINNHCQKIYCLNYRISFDRIPISLLKGLIGIEDFRYLNHFGLDLKSILRAFMADLKAMRFVQGGSTLTQQLVKNIFLNQERSWKRKINEAILSIYVEMVFTKEQILTAYFNEVVWGGLQGIRIKGIYAASLFYMDKRLEDLTSYEVAILISLLKGPYFYHPINHTERLKNRAHLVHKKLIELGLLSEFSKEDGWTDSHWEKWVGELEEKQDNKPYFSLWKVINNNASFLGQFEQFAFERAVETTKMFLKNRIKGEDMAVKAIIGAVNCEGACQTSFKYYSKFERNKPEALDKEQHQVGSILKPIIYSSLIRHGLNWTDEISTSTFTLELKSGPWSPKEASPVVVSTITALDALKRSRNRPLIQFAKSIGFEKLELELKHYLPNLISPLGEYPAQLIGAIELSMEEVFEVYTKFVHEQCALAGGEDLGEENILPIEKTILYKLSDPSETTIRRVVNRSLVQARFFGKTGTTNSGLDNWYVAFDGKYLYVIWFGLEGDRRGKSLKLGGASSAFRLFQNYLIKRGRPFYELNCDHVSANLSEGQ